MGFAGTDSPFFSGTKYFTPVFQKIFWYKLAVCLFASCQVFYRLRIHSSPLDNSPKDSLATWVTLLSSHARAFRSLVESCLLSPLTDICFHFSRTSCGEGRRWGWAVKDTWHESWRIHTRDMPYPHKWYPRGMTQAPVTRLVHMCAGGWALFVPFPLWNIMQASRNDDTKHWYIMHAHTHTLFLSFTYTTSSFVETITQMLTQTTYLIVIHALTLTRSQAHFQSHTHAHSSWATTRAREKPFLHARCTH